MAIEEMFTELPTVSNSMMSDIICAVQGYVSPSNLGLSTQQTLSQVFSLFQSNIILFNSGDPNGSVAGTTYQFCWDSLHSTLYMCVSSGTATTAVWIRADINDGYTTTVTAAGTTTLTILSTYWQFFTGATTQTVVMPVESTLSAGMTWGIVNLSSGAVTIQSSGLNTITTLAAGQTATVTCILNSGTTAASWHSSVAAIGGGVTSLTGTANQVLVNGTSGSAQTGALTLTLPQDIATTSSPTFNNMRLTGNILDANANNVIGITSAASAVNYVIASNAATGFAPGFTAAGSDANVNIEYVTKGTGRHTMLAATTTPFGFLSGTGFQHSTIFNMANTSATRNVTFQDADGTLAYLTDITANGTVNSGTANQIGYYASSGTVISGLASANSSVLVTNSTGVPSMSGTLTNGQLIIGSTGATPTAATLTAGTGISVTNAAGSITIAVVGGGLAVATISGTTQAAAVNTSYIALNAGQTTVTLPAVYAVGDRIELVGSTANTGGWILATASGDTVRVNNATTSASGTVTSAAVAGQTIEVICDVANTSWVMRNTSSTILTTT